MSPRRVRFLVRGRVQGVSFRAFTASTGERLGLCGEVWNVLSGEVAGWAQGESAAIDALLEALHAGPPAAIVASVRGEEAPAEPNVGEGFRVIPGKFPLVRPTIPRDA